MTTDRMLAEPVSSAAAPQAWWQRLEDALERMGERLNPILVKEARQAMKSRQFSITFTLLLVFGLGWSILGVVLRMPVIYYAPDGPFMLIGYYLILAVPMLLIVPFSAYRSLAAERDDGTYELLSITALSARQIVTGKLGSAVLQMMVFYSALAPCIAFTYLLRGVDIVSIVLLLFYTFLLSLLLSAAGLGVAGLARARQWHSLFSVLLLLALVASGFLWCSFVVGIVVIEEQLPLDEPSFWIGQLAAIMFYATYLALFIFAAAAQNSFPSDNRSTRLRVIMLLQLLVLVGWTAYGWMSTGWWFPVMFAFSAGAIHWYLYGVLLTGESAKLSPRVRRQLPVSFLGRAFLTWFNPGSGTGYVFAVVHCGLLAALAFAAIVATQWGLPGTGGSPVPLPSLAGDNRELLFIALVFAYFVGYLGLGRIVVTLIPRRERYGLALSLLIHIVMLLLAMLVPITLGAWRERFDRIQFDYLQAPNFAWTLTECLDNGLISGPEVPYLVFTFAGISFVVNIVLAAGEVEHVRVPTPARVCQEPG